MTGRVDVVARSVRTTRANAHGPRLLVLSALGVLAIAGARSAMCRARARAAGGAHVCARAGLAAQGFAQSFVRAYLTGDARNPERHARQVAPYVSRTLDPGAGLRVPEHGTPASAADRALRGYHHAEAFATLRPRQVSLFVVASDGSWAVRWLLRLGTVSFVRPHEQVPPERRLMHRRGALWRLAAVVFGAAAAIVAGCGDPDGTPSRSPTPAHNASTSTSARTVPEDVRPPAAQRGAAGTETVRPPDPQLLAFAGNRHVGVVDGDRVRVLARTAAGSRLVGLQWSADGRRLGWLRRRIRGILCRRGLCPEFVLTVIDVASGRQHRHTPDPETARSTAERLAYSPTDILAPGLTGVTLGAHRLGFREFLADGRSTRYVVPVPFAARRRAEVRLPTTGLPVRFATRVDGAWLVATLDANLIGRGRLYRYSPRRRTLMALDRLHTPFAGRTFLAGPAFAADGGAVVWSGADPPTPGPVGQGCDDPSHRLQTPTGQLPAFPRSPGWNWRVHEVTLAPQGIDAIAGRMRNPTDLETRLCDRPREAFERLGLRAPARHAGSPTDGVLAVVVLPKSSWPGHPQSANAFWS